MCIHTNKIYIKIYIRKGRKKVSDIYRPVCQDSVLRKIP